MTIELKNVASVIRSKNAGPFELTLDIFFKDEAVYRLFQEHQLITRELIAGLYKVRPDAVSQVVYFEPAFAIKVTLDRPIGSGEPGETDVYGAQQHAPLLGLSFTIPD